MTPRRVACVIAAVLLVAGTGRARADPASGSGDGFWVRPALLGDPGDVRSRLKDAGIDLAATEISEVLGNATGGIRTGAVYHGLTTLTLDVSPPRWPGNEFYVSALQIHGRSLGDDNTVNLQTPSGIEANRSTRLWEIWYQRDLLNTTAGLVRHVDVRIGQQSADQEFLVSAGAGLFLNTSMGWPVVPSLNLYAGGPAYPLSSLGIRVRAAMAAGWTVLAGVFDDNPPGGPFGDDSEVRGASQSGTKFNLGTGALFLAELQYTANQPPSGDGAADNPERSPARSYKAGLWWDTRRFPDQRYDSAGRSLADPQSTGVGRPVRGNFGLYAVADQELWHTPRRADGRSLDGFIRAAGAPSRQNLVTFGINAGVVLSAPFADRSDDRLGLGMGFTTVSSRAAGLDGDTARFSGMPYPRRGSESFVEATYLLRAAGWWVVQPDVQYVFMPGGGIPNPSTPGKRVGNELILGLRTVVTF